MCVVTEKEFLGYLSANGVSVSEAGMRWFAMFYPIVLGTIENILGYKILQSTVSEFLPVRSIASINEPDPLASGVELSGGLVVARQIGSRALQTLTLSSLPVRSITSIYENVGAWTTGATNGDWPSTTLLNPTSYYLDMKSPGISLSGRVHRLNGVWSTYPRSIKITYVCGYTEDEVKTELSYLRMPVLVTLAHNYAQAVRRGYQTKLGGTMQSISIEDFSISIGGQNTNSMSSGGELITVPEGAMFDLQSRINITRYLRGQ